MGAGSEDMIDYWRKKMNIIYIWLKRKLDTLYLLLLLLLLCDCVYNIYRDMDGYISGQSYVYSFSVLWPPPPPPPTRCGRKNSIHLPLEMDGPFFSFFLKWGPSSSVTFPTYEPKFSLRMKMKTNLDGWKWPCRNS